MYYPRFSEQLFLTNPHQLLTYISLSATKQIPPELSLRGILYRCLAVSYFHMGFHTIIGAESFHGPVRDGKAWDQLAMAARLKLSNRLAYSQLIVSLLPSLT